MVRNAELLFTAIEDQRHDKVLFIIKMTDEPLEQDRACVRVAVTATAKGFAVAAQRLQERIGGLCGPRHVAVNVMVVAFQYVKSDG